MNPKDEIIESQRRVINALQNERNWLQDVIYHPGFNEIDMRLMVEATPREMRCGFTDEVQERKIYYPALAEKADCSEKVASQHIRKLAQAGVFSYRTERDPDSGNSRVYLQPLPSASVPSHIVLDPARRGGGSTWENGKRIKTCNACGSANLVKVAQIVCGDCGTAQNEKTYKPVNDPGCQSDTDPESASEATSHSEGEEDDEQEESSLTPNSQSDTWSPEDEISNVPPSTVNTLQVDTELHSLPLWCCHRNKVPYNAKPAANNAKAKPNDPSTWTTYEQALETFQQSQSWKLPYDGIGVMNNGNYTFIDQDHCRDKDTGQVTPEAQARVDALNSYTEVSQSDTGLHTIVSGSIPKAVKRPGIEMYNHHR